MKVAFINPPTLIGHISFINKQYTLNILILSSYLRSYNIEVKVWDFGAEKFSKEGLLKKIEHWQPDIAGLTALTSTINNAAYIAKIIKDYNPDIKTIIGGIHASALPVRTLEEFSYFDLLIYGEGERTLLEVIESIKNKNLFSNIKGLCYRKNNKIIKNEPRDLIDDINEIPFPARDLISRHLYKGSAFRGFLSQETETDFIITSRGCMGKCTFCASNLVYHGKLRYRSAKNVLEEIKECKNECHTKHIVIMDDTFTTLNKRLTDICEGIKSLGISWNCFGRVDLVDEEKIKIMAESGCRGIQFGVESGSQRILGLIKKGITIEQIKKAFNCANKYGIITDATVILGADPSETKYDIRMTERLLRRIKPRMLSCAILIPFPGTEINKTMKEKGYIKDEKWNDYVLFGKRPPDYRTDYFTYEELREIQNKLLMKFYLRPSFIINKLLTIHSLKELKYWIRITIDFIKEVIFRVSENE